MGKKRTALYERGQKLVLLQDDRQIAETVLEIAAQLLDFQDSGFWLADPGGRAWRLVARRGRFQGSEDSILDGEQGIVVAAAQRGQPIYVPDVRQDPRYVHAGSTVLSKLALPVRIGDRVLGVLSLESDRPDPFGETERELLSILSDQAALALENARLHAEQRRQVEETFILNELARRISASLDLEVTLDVIVAAAAELIPCALAEVSLWDEASQTLTLQAIRCEPDRTYPLGKSFPAGEGYTGWVVRQRQPLLVPDVDARRDVRPHLLPGERPFKAYAGVPLLAKERLLGTLVLVADQTGAFGPADLCLLQALAHQAAIAIRNAHLYQQEARRRRELSALYAVAEAVNRPGDLDQILAEGLKQAIAVLGLDMGAIAIKEPRDGRLALKAHRGMSPKLVIWLEEHLGQKPLERWPEGTDLDVDEISPSASDVPDGIREQGVRLTADVPLFAEGEMVGVLSVGSRQVHAFAPEERSLLMAIGHQLGTAIANARLRQEALAAERLAAVGRVATSVAHDLRSPLGGILRSAEFLARSELSPDTRDKLSQAIVSLARRLVNTSQEILDYVRGESLPLKRTPCPVNDFLDETLAVLEVDFSDQGIEVVRDFGYGGKLVIDTDRMAQVLYNLAANARDAMPDGGTFSVSTRRADGEVELCFGDTGPGVPQELGERIFEPFFTYGKRQGAGLGLAIARRIVEQHGGRLWVESDREEGARFFVSLPL